MTPFDAKYMASYLMAIVMFALSLTVYVIFANQEKCANFDIENEGDGYVIKGRDLHRSTENFRIYTVDFFFRSLATRQHTFTQKADIYTHTARDRGAKLHAPFAK